MSNKQQAIVLLQSLISHKHNTFCAKRDNDRDECTCGLDTRNRKLQQAIELLEQDISQMLV